MMSAIPYSVPQEPGRWRAITLAVIVHAMLFTFLWVGIRWQNDTPQTIEAEVWSPLPQEAAPPPPPPPPPEPTPEVKQPAPEVKEVPPVEKPDIALAQEKKKLAAEKKAREDEKKAEKKAEKLQADKEKKLADEKKRKQDALDAKKMEALHKAELKRVTGEINAPTNGSAVRTQGSRGDASWSQRVAAKVKSNIIFATSADLETNAPAEFEVGLLPDGSVAGVRQTKSSGITGFDDAVRRAIEKSQPYPADSTGKVPSSFISSNRPKDQ